jgi:zinc protease
MAAPAVAVRQQRPGPEAFMEPAQRYCLDNGLTVVLAPSRGAEVAAVQAWVRVGASDESDRTAGTSHLLEHMLFKGTARRGAGELVQAIEAVGGGINAWTSFDQTVFSAVLPSNRLATGIEVLADLLQHSRLDPDELERERAVVLEEIRAASDDPARRLAGAVYTAAFPRHPYGRPVLGWPRTVSTLARPRLLSWFRDHYVASNMVVVVAGDFEPGRAQRELEQEFGAMPAGAAPPRRQHRAPRRQTRIRVLPHQLGKAHLAIGFRIPPLSDRRTPALDLAAILLGQGRQARLAGDSQARGLFGEIHAHTHSFRQGGVFFLAASTEHDELERATAGITEEVVRLTREEVGERELGRARRAALAGLVFERESVERIAARHGLFEIAAGSSEQLSAYLRALAEVSPGALRQAMERIFDLDNATIVAMTPAAVDAAAARSTERRLRGAAQGVASAISRQFAVRAAARSRAGDVVQARLPGGMRILVKRDTSIPVVAMRAVWAGGSRLETAASSGITHLIARLITRGCGGRTGGEISRMVDELAGTFAGFSGRSSFGLRAEWLAQDWELGFDLLADCVAAPRFPAEELLAEKRQVLAELLAQQESSRHVAHRLFVETLYRRHPYRLNPLGSPASVPALSRSRLLHYYRNQYPVADLTLVVVGDLDPERVLARVRARLGSLAGQSAAGRSPLPEEQFDGRPRATREVYQFLPGEQAQLVIGFPGVRLDDPDRFALAVTATLLGAQGGRLFSELRERRSLAYRVGAHSQEGVEPGYFAVHTACSPEHLSATVELVRAELERLSVEVVSPAELDRARSHLLGGHQLSLQRRSALAAALAFHEAHGLGYREFLRYPAAIRSVSAADVQRIARKYLNWDRAVIAAVRPPALSPAAARRARGVRRSRR